MMGTVVWWLSRFLQCTLPLDGGFHLPAGRLSLVYKLYITRLQHKDSPFLGDVLISARLVSVENSKVRQPN